jgi:hypothetical protein
VAGSVNLRFGPQVSAPTEPYELGVEVGVPTGTSLTNTSGLPAADATEDLLLVHPVTGASTTRSCSVWRRRRWTTVPTVSPGSGATYLFDECEWDVPLTSWCVEIPDTNGTADQMQPLAVFRNCQFDGNDDSSIALAGSHIWVINCHITGASDGWQGAAYSVAMDSNIIAGTDINNPDPHSDGMQNAGTGQTTVYHCWTSAGPTAGANSAIRFGSEFGAVANPHVYYCGIDEGGYALAMRGDAGGGAGITGAKVVGCRWTTAAVFGPTDFEDTTVSEWTDNKFFDGTVINNPAP